VFCVIDSSIILLRMRNRMLVSWGRSMCRRTSRDGGSDRADVGELDGGPLGREQNVLLLTVTTGHITPEICCETIISDAHIWDLTGCITACEKQEQHDSFLW
jgi:hypothetical protein